MIIDISKMIKTNLVEVRFCFNWRRCNKETDHFEKNSVNELADKTGVFSGLE